MGYGDWSRGGHPTIRTPHLDALANTGVQMTQFYSASPVCSPTRASLLTGRHAVRTGVLSVFRPGNGRGLPRGEITLARALRPLGYTSACIGKWHLGDAPEFLPTRQGFDEYFGIPFSNDMWRYHPKMPPREDEDELMRATRQRAAYTGFAGQGGYYGKNGGFPNDLPLMRGETVIEKNPDQRQLTIRYTEAARQFIEQNRNRPFFLYLAHAMPHVPLFVSKEYAGQSPRGLYGDVMMEIDWSTGRILDQLKALGLDEKTLVVFTSDNGPWLEYGIDGGSAGPLREGKGTTWEGGVRVPGIVRWPGTIPAGRRTDAIAGTMDLLPTFAYLAGADLPKDRAIDGRNLWPLLSGQTDRSPHEHFHYFGGSAQVQVNYRGIRDQRWKLVLALNEGRPAGRELYDLGQDVGEKFDRMKDHPDIAQRLEAEARRFHADFVKNIRPLGRRAEP